MAAARVPPGNYSSGNEGNLNQSGKSEFSSIFRFQLRANLRFDRRTVCGIHATIRIRTGRTEVVRGEWCLPKRRRSTDCDHRARCVVPRSQAEKIITTFGIRERLLLLPARTMSIHEWRLRGHSLVGDIDDDGR